MMEKIIFATDLDQTLIYSRRSMGDSHQLHDLVPVERYKGQYISYMTTQSVEQFCEVSKQALVVPVTTRTIEQYKRVTLPTQPYYAVVSNGGHILIDGEPDQAWHHKIQSQIQEKCLGLEEMEAEFSKIAAPDWVTDRRRAEHLFLFYIIERTKVPTEELERFSLWAYEQNWRISIQGRKLYLVPKPVSKWAAVEEILERVGHHYVVAAGDSLLDQEMLEKANLALAPSHGELWSTFCQKKQEKHCEEDSVKANTKTRKITFLPQQGMKAGEEILNCLLSLCEERKEGPTSVIS
ncbi:HAD family hydrolase [Heliorestis convoluta]|uniref:Haloacid dehalogenase, putative n=1 Tax=Heliorestis convoluta TaxID=356322 RepID=A0A5Q2MZQ2_9FIRM|nr:HAD family hydrolase [Heliorestis convoluta]QGG47521.1 haloacid dehalogenase, putative [Heliorestis convoluta]